IKRCSVSAPPSIARQPVIKGLEFESLLGSCNKIAATFGISDRRFENEAPVLFVSLGAGGEPRRLRRSPVAAGQEILRNSVLPLMGMLKFATPGTTRLTPSTVPPGTSRPGRRHSMSIIPSSTIVVPVGVSCTRSCAFPPTPLNVVGRIGDGPYDWKLSRPVTLHAPAPTTVPSAWV